MQNFIAATFRLNKVGMCLIKFEQPFAELRQREVVAIFTAPDGWSLVCRAAFSFVELFFGFEGFTTIAVPAFVGRLVDVPGIEDLLNESPAAGVVAGLRCLDEIVKRNVQGAPHFAELTRHVVAIRLHGLPEFSSTASHLDGVLVVSHQEKDLVTFHAAVTGLNIGTDFFKRRANVWPTVGIIDCCR